MPHLPSHHLSPSPKQLVEGMGFVWGRRGWNVIWRIWILSVFPTQVPGRREAEGGGDRPWRCAPPPNPTITHTLGLLLGPGQGESKCVAADLFSIFLSVLYGDAFVVFYTQEKTKSSRFL